MLALLIVSLVGAATFLFILAGGLVVAGGAISGLAPSPLSLAAVLEVAGLRRQDGVRSAHWATRVRKSALVGRDRSRERADLTFAAIAEVGHFAGASRLERRGRDSNLVTPLRRETVFEIFATVLLTGGLSVWRALVLEVEGLVPTAAWLHARG
jgi:hypothetical protein